MAVNVVVSYPYTFQSNSGVPLRKAKLTIAGLAAGAANVVPHGLPSPPTTVSYAPGASGGWGETAPPDATSLYITVGAGGATSGSAYVEY